MEKINTSRNTERERKWESYYYLMTPLGPRKCQRVDTTKLEKEKESK